MLCTYNGRDCSVSSEPLCINNFQCRSSRIEIRWRLSHSRSHASRGLARQRLTLRLPSKTLFGVFQDLRHSPATKDPCTRKSHVIISHLPITTGVREGTFSLQHSTLDVKTGIVLVERKSYPRSAPNMEPIKAKRTLRFYSKVRSGCFTCK